MLDPTARIEFLKKKDQNVKKRLLLIGIPPIHDVPSIAWNSIDKANPADFDIVILDIESLRHRLQNIVPRNPAMFEEETTKLQRLGKRIAKLLQTKGSLIVLCPKAMDVYTKPPFVPQTMSSTSSHKFREIYDCSEWLPIGFKTVDEKGKTFIFSDEAWHRYIDESGEWDFYFDISNSKNSSVELWRDLHKRIWSVSPVTRKLVTSRAEELIVVGVSLLWDYKLEPGGSILRLDDRPHSGGQTGQMILAPRPKLEDISVPLRLLLEDLNLIDKETVEPPPEWVDKVFVTGMDRINENLTRMEIELIAKQKEINLAMAQKQELEKWRGLVYLTGHPLQQLCELAFTELGAITRPSDVSDEFVVILGDKEMLVEVKGLTKAAAKTDLGQLLMDSSKPTKSNKPFDKLALVVNAWRKLPLEKRGTHQNPWFSEEVISIASAADIVLITTQSLLDSLNDNWTTRKGYKALQTIFDSKGILNRPNVQKE